MAKRPIVRNRKEDVGFRWGVLPFSGLKKNRTSHKNSCQRNKKNFYLKIHLKPNLWILGALQIVEQTWQG
jgi:hypothetical protein